MRRARMEWLESKRPRHDEEREIKVVTRPSRSGPRLAGVSMNRAIWIFGLLLIAGSVACRPENASRQSVAAPSEQNVSRSPALPTDPGTVWEYEVTTELPENAVELTDPGERTRPLAGRRLRATRTTTLDGPADLPGRHALRFTTRVNGEVERVDYRVVSNEQIADVATDLLAPSSAENGHAPVRQITFAEPLPLVRFPIEIGDTWQARFQVDGHPVSRTFDVLGKESVTVPAGTFEAWRIRTIGSDRPGHSLESTTWFAPGTGFVKSRVIHTAAFGLLKVETSELTRDPGGS